MGKELAKEWLKAAKYDLDSISYMIEAEHLTNIIAFHSQQAIEKSFKAIIEYKGEKVPKKHDLFALYEIIKEKIPHIDKKVLFKINDLYIDSRYPGDLGLLPYGKPTIKDAQEFYDFAKEIFYKVCEILDMKEEDFGTR